MLLLSFSNEFLQHQQNLAASLNGVKDYLLPAADGMSKLAAASGDSYNIIHKYKMLLKT